jgi:transcriptional regulator with XRE-family HTH domain
MDPVKFGLSLRALRRRRGLTQAQVAREAGVARMTVQRIERGAIDAFTGGTVRRVAVALGARYEQELYWRGEGLDRLLDQDHAAIVEVVVRWLHAEGWTVVPEATFVLAGRRGSVDVLAFHPLTASLLIVEVKTVVADMQGLLGSFDHKLRAATVLARAQGWRPASVSRVLVLPDDRTARRRVAQHAATLHAVLPARTRDVRAWVRRPEDAIAGILFQVMPRRTGGRHRVRRVAA